MGRREEKSGDEVSGLNERGWEGQKEGISVWDSVPWWAGRLWEMRGWKYRCWGQEGSFQREKREGAEEETGAVSRPGPGTAGAVLTLPFAHIAAWIRYLVRTDP